MDEDNNDTRSLYKEIKALGSPQDIIILSYYRHAFILEFSIAKRHFQIEIGGDAHSVCFCNILDGDWREWKDAEIVMLKEIPKRTKVVINIEDDENA